MSQVWFVTGASTGFGRILAEELLTLGHQVVATARKPEVLADLASQYPDQFLAARLDVTQPEEAKAAIDATIAKFGRLDVLINNAGFGVFGSIEEVPVDEFRRQFETNFFGVINVLQAALPTMRKQRSGRILNVSSIAGISSFMGTGVYCSSKFALEAVSESLHHELSPLGIRTILIEPGAFKTDFLGHNYTTYRGMEDYEKTAGEIIDYFKTLIADGDPKKAVHAMIEVAQREDPPMRLLLGKDAWSGAHRKVEWLIRDFSNNASVTLNVDLDPE
jgi:NAD(P)-dependent dehydrogenase (short-subunit alcohol dehydrogenase family)